MLRNMVVMTMMASPIQNRTKKPRKSRWSLLESKWDKRAAYSIVGKRRCLCWARTCRRADDIE